MTRTLVKIVIILIVIVVSHLVAHAGGVEHVLRIDDFEDGDVRAPNGVSWIVLADDLFGGDSVGRLEIVTGEEAASKGALKVAGRRSGKAGSIVGAWLPVDGTGRALDLSAFQGFRLRVKSAIPLHAGFRVGNVNFMATIEGAAGWRDVEVPFDSLAPLGKVPEGTRFTPGAAGWFGVTTPMIMPGAEVPSSDVVFEIDDLALYGRAETSMDPAPAAGPGLVSVLPLTRAASVPAGDWTLLAIDPEGDATRASLPDVTRLEVLRAQADDMMWFRMTLRETPHDRWMGVNLALDADGDPKNGQPWWGANKEFHYDRLVTAYCFPVAGGGCQGMFGIVDADQAASGTYTGGGEGLRVAIDHDRRAFIVGVPRAALHLGKGTNRVVAAVGSALFFGDDVPNSGAAVIR